MKCWYQIWFTNLIRVFPQNKIQLCARFMTNCFATSKHESGFLMPGHWGWAQCWRIPHWGSRDRSRTGRIWQTWPRTEFEIKSLVSMIEWSRDEANRHFRMNCPYKKCREIMSFHWEKTHPIELDKASWCCCTHFKATRVGYLKQWFFNIHWPGVF